MKHQNLWTKGVIKKMNNKILIGIIGALVVLGGILVFSGQILNNQGGSEKRANQNITPAAAQNDTDASRGTPITETVDTINVTSTGFEPQATKIQKDRVVIWINKTGQEVGIKSDSFAPLNLGRFPVNSSVQLIFDKEGTYEYYNELNPEQKGTIIVE